MEKTQEKHFGDPDKSERNTDLFNRRARISREHALMMRKSVMVTHHCVNSNGKLGETFRCPKET